MYFLWLHSADMNKPFSRSSTHANKVTTCTQKQDKNGQEQQNRNRELASVKAKDTSTPAQQITTGNRFAS